jgi:Ino eighty subunit 1
VDFLDLFLPINLSSVSRARAFLWLIFHYLSEPDAPNPFDDECSRQNPGKVPRLQNISREEMERENQDPAEEIQWGRRMSAMRSKFLKELVDEMSVDSKKKKAPTATPQSTPYPTTGFSGMSQVELDAVYFVEILPHHFLRSSGIERKPSISLT